MNRIIGIAWVIGLIIIQSCGKDSDPTCTKEVAADKISAVDQTRLASDITAIDNYLMKNGIVAQAEPNGVRYTIASLGTGVTYCLESKVTATYKGLLLSDPTKAPFDQNTVGATFSLSGLILGWQLVLPKYAPVGTKLTLYIPSGYAYGSSVAGGGKIPANANLIFEMEILAVK